MERRLAAIFSADVKGYSRLMGDDEVATVQTIKRYRVIMEEAIARYRGRVVDSKGDNLLGEFASVVDAVQAAVAIQKEIGEQNRELPENRRMEFRIGINLGDVIVDGDQIYGDGVNIAARAGVAGRIRRGLHLRDRLRSDRDQAGSGLHLPGPPGGQKHYQTGPGLPGGHGSGKAVPGGEAPGLSPEGRAPPGTAPGRPLAGWTPDRPDHPGRGGRPGLVLQPAGLPLSGRPADRGRFHHDHDRDPPGAGPAGQALPGGPALCEHERRSGAGILQRRDDRGPDHRSLQDRGDLRYLAQLFLHLQGPVRPGGAGQPGAGGPLCPGRLGSQGPATGSG
jgi:hypothetical protein